jgi:acyl-[acyl-carrier-protein]-phospholipid O-acyltransferase/long-chain-fatty-acid--[acyl-carrier-protein] ligase
VTVTYGRPLPPTAPAFEVRRTVQELTTAAWPHRRDHMRPLQRTFIHVARRHPFRFAMADARVPKLRAAAALTRTVFLARRLRSVWEGQAMVGILLPPSVAGALVNYAALLMGKVPVNLNYTAAGWCLLREAMRLTTIVSSRAFWIDWAAIADSAGLLRTWPETRPREADRRGSELAPAGGLAGEGRGLRAPGAPG